MKKNNIPALRFPQFNEPWAVKKLGEVCECSQLGGNYENDLTPNDYPLIKMGNMARGHIDLSKLEYVSNGIPSNNDKLFYGDFLFNTRNTLDLVGKVCVWRDELKDAYFNSNIMRIKFSNSNSFFMNYCFNTQKYLSLLKSIATGTTSVAAIYNKDLFSLPISLPTLPEQQKIADFLSGVDEKIGQLERRLALEEQYKKGMMQRLFDQEIRFKDDNGNEFPDWEEKSAGDLFYSHTNKNHNGDLPILAITQDRGAVLRDEIDYTVQVTEQSIKTYKIIEPGDFIISLRSFQGGIEYSNVLGISSPAYTVLKPSLPVINIFYKYYLKKDSFIQALSNTVEGIRDGKNISYKNFSVLTLPYPTLPEQQKIADFLSSLDDKIGQTKAELEKARVWKRGLMQRMFV